MAPLYLSGFLYLTHAFRASHERGHKMKKLITALLSLSFACSIAVAIQNSNSSTTQRQNKNANSTPKKRPPIFRASKDQINQAQAILKQRGFYNGEQIGKIDADTRAGLKKYQQAQGLKVTGTLNKVTLEKMGIALTEKQKSM
jgi:peptidoglycan hydrolase-like protein with peptidoglycan-binding domain